MKTRILLLCLPLALFAASCNTPVEKTAYETVVGAKAFTDSIKAHHPECVTGPASSTTCVLLARAIAAKDTIIDAAEVACAGPNFDNGGACDFPKKGTPGYDQAVAKINSAIANYNQIAGDLKSLK